MTRTKKPTTPVESIRHKDKRTNIPTEELRDFVADEEQAPKTMLYPRDPSLDPQLVWKGKDQQDREDLAVPVVPVYIQEKIHPRAVIGDFRLHLPSPFGRGAGGEGDLLNLLIEVTGEKKKDKAAKVATARTLWVPAVNNHRGFGRWAFVEVADPWNAMTTIRGLLENKP